MTIIADIFEVSTLDQDEKLPWNESCLKVWLVWLCLKKGRNKQNKASAEEKDSWPKLLGEQ